MAKYKEYPEYKDSGVEWLGKIPEYWNILTGKRIFQSVRTPALNNDEQLAASQKYGVIPQSLMMQLNDSKVMLALKGTDSFRHVDENNFVISLRSFEGGIEHSKYSGCVSPAYTVLKNNKPISYNYYQYLLKCAPFIAALQSSTDSLRDGKSINYEQFGALNLPLTSISEQSHIAYFLDYETAKIDNLIAKQQQLIELLKEKRQAVISHAVTKGLNPDVPMKDSGVEWLRNIPEHWEQSRIGWICNVGNGCTPSRENTLYWQNGSYPWLNSSKVNDERILTAEQFVTTKALYECSLPIVKKGSVIIAITGEGKTRGTSALMMINATINQHVAYITPRAKDRILPEFIHLWLQSKYQKIRTSSEGWGSTKAAITCSDVKCYPIPMPPLKEQIEIVSAIEDKKAIFTSLLLNCEQQIEILQERRTALISAAVTGKIDVRDWVAPDTQDVEEPQEATA